MNSISAKRDPILGGWRDGWEHTRDASGFCNSCGAGARELHYALIPRDDAPIYRKMVR